MSNHRNVQIKAHGGSITSGQRTVTGNISEGSPVPEVSVVSGENQPGQVSSSMNLQIEALDSDISCAHETAVHLNVTPSSSVTEREQQLSDPETPSPTTDTVPLSPSISVTGGSPSGATTLHFFVHEKGKYIQIGQCCVVVELHVNDGLMEKLKKEGTLEVDTHTGASVVTLRWRGIEETEEVLRTRIKAQLTSSLTENLQALERTVLEDLVNKDCDKCQKLVTFLLQEMRGHLADISLGCFQLTVLFTSQEELEKATSSDSLQRMQKFLESLLVTEKVQELVEDVRFSVTVLGEEAAISYKEVLEVTTLYRREDKTSSEKVSSGMGKEISELKSFLSHELTSLRAGQAREIMTQEQLTRQIGAQVQQCVTEELDQFRQRQVQVLRDAIAELLPGLQQRLYENVVTKLQDSGISESVQHQTDEALSSAERISRLVSFVQSKAPQVLPEVKVRQRGPPVDFLAFFSAIQGLSYKDEEKSEEDEGYTDTKGAGLHEKLMKIWGEDGVKVVQHSMEMATQATEKLDKGEISDQFCTVLCLDLSHSMAGNPIKQQRKEAERIVQSCLGQIAVVTIGDKTKVEQDLTQDKDTVKKILEHLHVQPYGQMTSSPVIQGLLTALKLLQLRVKPTEIGHHHKLYPKIVIISDGLFNDCSPESEETKQPCSKTDSLFGSVLEVMAALNIHVPIYFVPIGEKLDTSSSWFDTVTVVKDVDFLSDSMETETLTGRVMSAIMEPKEPQTPAKSWQAIKKDLIRKKQHTKEINRVEWFITEHFKKPPPIGTRVKVSGTESQPTGTILQHIKGQKGEHDTKTKYVLVVLDTGDKEYYRWTFDQEKLLFYKSSPDSGHAAIPVGTLVHRGRHWNYNNQDGGPDEIGVAIINKDGGRLVKVCWRSPSAAHELNVYRYGDQERFDIEKVEPPLIDLTGLTDSGYPRWEVSDEAGKWKTLTGVSALQLEDSVALRKSILTMQEGHTQGTFRLEGDKLTDFNTQKTLRIRKMEET
ncbi:uncharacterized protein LOC133178222 [Saccostrea echinata]|uniref:uncharacterized protein LOC133178222 n=1 Tax=Saccostrea echinata TaxID=191078 RepID=UPI002A81C109|nr:uncharacterized protein LOC133178222 [Saccostrea echinata]